MASGHIRSHDNVIRLSDASARSSPASAERRQLTIVFIDIAGSTSLSERLDPEDFFTILREYHQICDEIVVEHGGHVARRFGDGVLAFFGLPQAHEDDAERAVHAALSVAAVLRKHHFLVGGADSVQLGVRVAVNTGQVVAGRPAQGAPMDQMSVFGKPAHIASRLQELAGTNGVIIGPMTHKLVHGAFLCEYLGLHILKGVKDPVGAWKVDGAAQNESRFAREGRSRLTPMVGRTREVGELFALWDESLKGNGHVAAVIGEPGIGKSRLLQAFRSSIETDYEIVSLQCSPLHVNAPLSPIVVQIRRIADLRTGDDPPQIIAKLRALFSGKIPNVEHALRYYGALLSVPAHDEFLPADLGQARERDQALSVFAGVPLALSSARPVLVLFEDVHWVDPSSAELAQRMIEQLSGNRVLVILTYRDDYHPGWLDIRKVTCLPLARLTRDDCRRMVNVVAGTSELPRVALDQIVDRTDGIPLYVEEFTRAVLDAGALRQVGDRLFLKSRLPEPLVPATIQDSLMERLDRSGEAKHLAQEASVLGRQFSYPALRHLTGRAEADLARALTQLDALGLLHRQGSSSQATFTFKHAMIQEAAYASLMRDDRRQLHARAASWCRQTATAQDSGELGLLAYHCSRAGLAAEAAEAWLGAGKSALRRSASKEAVAHLRQGLDLLPELPPEKARVALEIELQSTLAMAYTALEGWSGPQVALAYEKALTLCREHGTIRQRSIALWGMAMAKLVGTQLREALDYAGEFVALSEACGNDEVLLMAHTASLIANFFVGRLKEAQASFEIICRQYNPRKHRKLVRIYQHDPKIMALVYGGHIQWLLGRPDRARQSCEEARQLVVTLDHPFMHVLTLILGVSDHLYENDAAATLESVEKGIRLAKDHGLKIYEIFGPLWSIKAMTARDPNLNTVQKLERLVETLIEYRCFLQAPLYQIGVAEEYARTGELARALALASQAEALMTQTGEIWFEPEIYRIQAMLRCRGDQRDPGAAAGLFRQAVNSARTLQAVGWELRAALCFAHELGGEGYQLEAAEVLSNALAKIPPKETSIDVHAAKAVLSSWKSLPPDCEWA